MRRSGTASTQPFDDVQREHFDHVVAAAANILNEDEFVVVGSQAILGSHPDAPGELLRSIDVDIYPLSGSDDAIMIDGALGDGSPFHRTNGYHAHTVGPETAKAPAGWRDRLVRVERPPRPRSRRRPVALCLEPHDLVLAKCVANRDRDWQFARDALVTGIVQRDLLLSRVDGLPVDAEDRRRIRAMLAAL